MCDARIMKRAGVLASEASIPPSIAAFLLRRGVETVPEVDMHFNASLAMLEDPFSMSDMEKAVDRLVKAVSGRERIGIFGDYDADGVTASALLYLFFRECGLDARVYIPHREKEGYGLNRQGIDFLKSEGCTLLVTVDSGITAVHEVEYAVEQGMDVIVTDHHEVVGRLPGALAVINPEKPECSFPFKSLAGVGVAFYLAWALRNRLHRLGHWKGGQAVNLKSYLDLVAIGTMADIVPVTGINRVFVRTGLEVVNSGGRPGIAALKDAAGVEGSVTTREVAFRLAPLVNAAGRMEHAMSAFKLLVADGMERARSLAGYLRSLNEMRQKVQTAIHKEASAMVDGMGDLPAYILYHEGWSRGVVGISASKLSDRLNRPVILMALDGDELCGSGRCPDGYNLVRLLEGCGRYLKRFGGHAGAAGLALKLEDFEAFRQAFFGECTGKDASGPGEPALAIDAEVSLNEISDPGYIEFLERLAPFGPGYEAPLFSMREFSLLSSSVVGNNHLKLRVADASHKGNGSRAFDVMGWNQGSRIELPWRKCELALEPSVNVWNGNRRIQFILRDVRKRS
jgi:single-stranded-DNA-specific exonuclease